MIEEDTNQNVANTLQSESAAPQEEVVAGGKLRFKTAAEISSETDADVPWIAKPWVAQNSITEVIGQPKSAGKTTWVMGMVHAVLDGEDFLGNATMTTSVVYLTEERGTTFRETLRRAGVLHRDDLHVLYWRETLGHTWETIVREAIEECHRTWASLLIIDTTSQFAGLLGDSENNAGDVLSAYKVLQDAAGQGLGVVSIRHERKGGGSVANAGRGSSAWTGAADIVLAIRRPEGQPSATVREIRALSRFDETPETCVIELTPTGYSTLDSAAIAKARGKTAILHVAPVSESDAQSIEQLVGAAGIARTTAQAVISELIAEGKIVSVGKGVRNDPRKYFAKTLAAGTASIEAADSNSAETSGVE